MIHAVNVLVMEHVILMVIVMIKLQIVKMILILEVNAQNYVPMNIHIVKLVIEIIHVLHVQMNHFLESFVMSLVRTALEEFVIRMEHVKI